MKVHVNIEALVLRGFPVGDRERISEALRCELTRLFTDKGTPPALRNGLSAGSMDAGSIRLAADCGPTKVGMQVARAVYGSLTNGIK